jgi:azurin
MKRTAIIFSLLCSAFMLSAQSKSIYMEGYDHLRYSVEKITVVPGTSVELTLKTVSEIPKSQMAHNWVLLQKDMDMVAFVNLSSQYKDNDYLAPGLTSKILAHTGMLGGGEEETISFTAPSELGNYTYVCTFPGHFVAGMKGTLIVQE